MFGSAVCVKHLPLVLLLVAGTALPAEHEEWPVPDEAARAKARATLQDVLDAETTKAGDERQDAYRAFQRAQAVLEENPVNPAANRIVGLCHCVDRGDWDQGVPMPALCDDPKLREAAVEQLQVKETAQAWITLAHAWWALEEEPFKLRAATRHKKALDNPRTTGLAAVKPKRRIVFVSDGTLQWLAFTDGSPKVVGRWSEKNAEITGGWHSHRLDVQIEGMTLRITKTHPGDAALNQQGVATPRRPR